MKRSYSYLQKVNFTISMPIEVYWYVRQVMKFYHMNRSEAISFLVRKGWELLKKELEKEEEE